MPEADFTSAHFLGLEPTGAPAALTSGRPAAVEEPPAARSLGRRLAACQGAGAGVLARTSLHGLLDVLATRPPGATVLLDEAVYPIGRWAAGATVGSGDLLEFRHHDAEHAARRAQRRGPVVVVSDGTCGACLRPAPLAELAAVTARHGGELVVDDTLAAGVLGRREQRAPVLGAGGGGTAAWLGVPLTGLVTVSSLAKGLSAPLAVVTGPTPRVSQVQRDGPTRVHAGPPTTADLAALACALRHPTLDAVRSRLAANLVRVRDVMQALGLRPLGIPFPVLSTEGGSRDPLQLHRELAASGVRTLATTGRCTGRPTLSLCIRADHTTADLSRLEHALRRAVRRAA